MPAIRPRIITPPAPPTSANATTGNAGQDNVAQGALQSAPAPPVRPPSLQARTPAQTAETAAVATPESATQQAAPATPPVPAAPSFWEWPKLTPQQQDRAETTIVDDTPTGPGISADPGTSIACLPQRLKTVLNKVAVKYGSVRVTSTYRPAWRARRGSYHRRCEAVDFRVPGHRPGEVLALVRTFAEAGGRKVYWNGLIHVDTGPERSW